MKPIGLPEAVAALRAELSESIAAAADEQIRFEVGEMQLQFQVAIERSAEASGGIKFWVVEFGANASLKSTATHTVTIPLKPVTASGQPILTGSSEVPDAAAS